jgi:hypothetical protein
MTCGFIKNKLLDNLALSLNREIHGCNMLSASIGTMPFLRFCSITQSCRRSLACELVDLIRMGDPTFTLSICTTSFKSKVWVVSVRCFRKK